MALCLPVQPPVPRMEPLDNISKCRAILPDNHEEKCRTVVLTKKEIAQPTEKRMAQLSRMLTRHGATHGNTTIQQATEEDPPRSA